MKLLSRPALVGLALAASLPLAFAACSKKTASAPATPAQPATPPAEPAKPAAKPLTDSISQAASQSTAAVSQIADEAAATAKRQAEAAAATAKREADAAAALARQAKAAMSAQPAPQVAPSAPSATTPAANVAPATNLTALTGDMAKQLEPMKAQAAEMLTRYSGEFETLKTGAVAIKKLIDQNAALLPAGVSAKYQELNKLLPALGTLVDALKNYQTADLTTLIPKVQADFAQAQKLYGEIKALMPAGTTLPAS